MRIIVSFVGPVSARPIERMAPAIVNGRKLPRQLR
jgi:hypothetical protein